MVYKKGYYICSVTKRVVQGPLKGSEDSVRVEVAHGVPAVDKYRTASFDDVDWFYSLIRYRPTEENIYIFRFDPKEPRRWVYDESHGFTTVPANPALARVFDELAPRWFTEDQAFRKRRNETYKEAMAAAGVKDSDFPKEEGIVTISAKGITRDATAAENWRIETDLLERISAHYPVLEPVAVAVEGLDEILEKLPVWRNEPSGSCSLPRPKIDPGVFAP